MAMYFENETLKELVELVEHPPLCLSSTIYMYIYLYIFSCPFYGPYSGFVIVSFNNIVFKIRIWILLEV